MKIFVYSIALSYVFLILIIFFCLSPWSSLSAFTDALYEFYSVQIIHFVEHTYSRNDQYALFFLVFRVFASA
jgi:PHP family Zn ribbon phosphoesterase